MTFGSRSVVVDDTVVSTEKGAGAQPAVNLFTFTVRRSEYMYTARAGADLSLYRSCVEPQVKGTKVSECAVNSLGGGGVPSRVRSHQALCDSLGKLSRTRTSVAAVVRAPRRVALGATMYTFRMLGSPGTVVLESLTVQPVLPESVRERMCGAEVRRAGGAGGTASTHRSMALRGVESGSVRALNRSPHLGKARLLRDPNSVSRVPRFVPIRCVIEGPEARGGELSSST